MTQDLAEYAARYGLSQSGARPGLPAYARSLIARRHFIVAYARARNEAQFTATALGQVWQILTPLLNAAVYYFIFGVLLNTRAGIDNYVAFLVTGIFIFTYTQRAIMAGARSVAGSLGLVRALHFPRAALPLSSTISELQQLLISMVVLCGIVIGTGEPIRVEWLLLVPILVLQTLFNSGLAMVFARINAQLRDVEQLLPFLLRSWQYASGVFYSLALVNSKLPGPAALLLEANPAAVYIDAVRSILLAGYQAPAQTWPLAVGWAIVMYAAGFVYFWQAEERYGRG